MRECPELLLRPSQDGGESRFVAEPVILDSPKALLFIWSSVDSVGRRFCVWQEVLAIQNLKKSPNIPIW